MNKRGLVTALALSFALGVFSAGARANVLAIIDSGTDMKHIDIASQAWTNPGEIPNNRRDDDRNGYPDDVHGWNFAEGNNQVIDYKYLDRYDSDFERFFDIQTKAMMGTMTPEEREWIIAKIEDQDFIKEITVFGNFMHGTHVGHIGLRSAPNARLLAVKLIPTEVNLPFYLRPGLDQIENDKSVRMRLLKAGLEFLANQQMQMMDEIAVYVHGHGATVANGSFGTGYAQAKMIVEMLFKNILRKDPTPEEVREASIHFLMSLVERGEQMVSHAPNTLFIFASGNDGTDNDLYPASPANIKADNVISVGASFGYGPLAIFSNYGKTTVDVLAPGVAIRAAMPGDGHMRVSGTSQAAPYVASIASHIRSINPELTPAQVKELIVGTVDVRSELADKVKSSGMVNRARATRAAELSEVMTLDEAINESRLAVADLPRDEEKRWAPATDILEGLILPLPSTFR